MENKHEENEELGYEASLSSIDQQSPREMDSFAYCRSSSEVSAFSEHTVSSSDGPSPLRWPVVKSPALSRLAIKPHKNVTYDIYEDQEPVDIELELMKEKFSKLLLGEDMSGSGKGVCTAVTVSNAITNLYASVFGRHLRLEPLSHDKILMWRREMNCLLSVCDYIVEFVPASQNLEDGTEFEVMSSRPRLDIYINLPALRKLDAMLLEILESFTDTEFWYAEQGSMSGNLVNSGSFRKLMQPSPRAEEKWWLPVPCVPSTGLSEKSRKHLRHKRDAANQIHKAAMAINNSILSEMQIPESYMTSLPKSGRASLGDTIYRYMYGTSKFSPERVIDSLKLCSEHEALELADRVEASMYTWRRKACQTHAKSSWDLVKEIVSDTDRTEKNTLLAERAESLLFSLKHRYPELSQTTLDTSKIHYNRDVGQAILESYSRVLEGLAFNIVSWVEDVLFVDKSMRNH